MFASFIKTLTVPFQRIWWFLCGMAETLKITFLTVFGRIRIYRYPMWLIYDPKGYEVNSCQKRKAMAEAQPGDVFCRSYKNYLDGMFIPGRYSHSGIYVGDGVIVHALGDGVQKIDIMDFLNCDGFAFLRPSCDDATKAEACRIAMSYVGQPYDFDFFIDAKYDNKDEVQKHSRSVYCHELVRLCYPHLRIPTIEPRLWNGAIRSTKKQFLAQSFFDSPDFSVVYDSKFSEIHNTIK